MTHTHTHMSVCIVVVVVFLLTIASADDNSIGLLGASPSRWQTVSIAGAVAIQTGTREKSWLKDSDEKGTWSMPTPMSEADVTELLMIPPNGHPFSPGGIYAHSQVHAEYLLSKTIVELTLYSTSKFRTHCFVDTDVPCLSNVGVACYQYEHPAQLFSLKIVAQQSGDGGSFYLQAHNEFDRAHIADCLRQGTAGIYFSARVHGSSPVQIVGVEAALRSSVPTTTPTEIEDVDDDDDEEDETPTNAGEEMSTDPEGDETSTEEEEETVHDGNDKQRETVADSGSGLRIVEIVIAALTAVMCVCLVCAAFYAAVVRTNLGRVYVNDALKATTTTTTKMRRIEMAPASDRYSMSEPVEKDCVYREGPPMCAMKVVTNGSLACFRRVVAPISVWHGRWRRFDAGCGEAHVEAPRGEIRDDLRVDDDGDGELVRCAERYEFVSTDGMRVYRKHEYDNEDGRAKTWISTQELEILAGLKRLFEKYDGDAECLRFVQRFLGLRVPQFSPYHMEVLTPDTDMGTLYDVLAQPDTPLFGEASYLALLQIGAAVSFLHRRRYVVRELGVHSVVVRRDIPARGGWMRVRCMLGEVTRARPLPRTRRHPSIRLADEPVTVELSAPEVLRFGLFSPKSDSFAFGALCWQLLAMPSGGGRFLTLYPRIQTQFSGDVDRCTTFMRDAICRLRLMPCSDGEDTSCAWMPHTSSMPQLVSSLIAPLCGYEPRTRMSVDHARKLLVQQLRRFKCVPLYTNVTTLASLCNASNFDTGRACVLDPGHDDEVTVEVSLLSKEEEEDDDDDDDRMEDEEEDASAEGSTRDEDDWENASFVSVQQKRA